MCKKMCMLLMVLLFCVPVQAGVYSWIWADSDAIGARVGTDLADNIEAGISALWFPDREWPQLWGVYALYHLPEIIEFDNPIVLDFLPETIKGAPYFGYKLDIDFEADKARGSLIGGIIFEDILFLEYQLDSTDRTATNASKLIFGIKIRW